MDVRVGLWRKLSAEELMLLNCGVGEDSWESLGLQGDPTSPSKGKSVLNIHWTVTPIVEHWTCNSSTLATWCEQLAHLKRPWFWERSKVGGEGDDRGWDGWMASPTQWTRVWASSGSWWWTGKPGMLQSMGSQKSDMTEWLNWSELKVRERKVESQVTIFHFSDFTSYALFSVIMLHAHVSSKGFPHMICINSLKIYEALLPIDQMKKLRFRRLISQYSHSHPQTIIPKPRSFYHSY